jgi:asparagine synthase (glutamine-hydrolysing)
LCGIAGFTQSNGPAGNRRIWDSIATIIHRGPDHQGCFESNRVCLGNARLKIIDLEGGDQPIISESNDVVIVFNGEIYNHEEIRHELEQKGHRFRSRTDTETVLEAFLEWDTECFSRLRGMFAVALWTESQNRLILARDRVGIKPLYIARRGNDLIFGSELKTIFAHPEIDRRLNFSGLDCYLALNYVPSPLTLVEGIEKLPPGHWLEWKDGRSRSECFWNLPFGNTRKSSLRAATEQLNALLRESVKEHLISDVPLGLWLSGGIDSSTILHYAASASSSPIRTFSISFDGRTFNDGDYSRQVAAHYGTRHEQLNFTEDFDLQPAIEEFAYYSDDPNADAGALPVWFLSKMTRRDVTVALSGEGADELFGGYLTYRANDLARMTRRVPQSLIRFAGGVSQRILPPSDDKISFEYKVKRFLEGCQMPFERAHIYWNGTFSDADKQELVNNPLPDGLRPILNELRSKGDKLKSFLWFDQKYFLADDILAKVDRISMAHSLEVRPPFLDHRIIEFASALPPNVQMQGSRQKVILRHLMRDKLPSSILRRKKVGFDIPAHEWLRGPLRSFMLDVLQTGMSNYPEVFNRSAIERCISQHLGRTQNLGYHLWGLMILFMWMRRWKIQSTQPAVLTESSQSCR